MEILCYVDSRAPRPLKRARSFSEFAGVLNARSFYPSVDIQAIARFVRAARKIFVPAILAVIAGWFLGYCFFYAVDAGARLVTVPQINSSAGEIEALDAAMTHFVIPKRKDVDESGTLVNTIPLSAMPWTQPVTFTSYTVKSGETISGIARQFNLTNISTLISVNDIQNTRLLRAGQKLSVPSIDGIFYRVKQGDTLAGISAKNNIAVEDILDVNNLDTTVIAAGSTLFLPGVHLDSETLKKAMGELFITPLSVSWRLSSAFGPRLDPFTGVKAQHTGIDMAAPMGTPIFAAMSGTVVVSSYSNVYGNYVIINHGNGYQTLYGHMQKILAQKGQVVNQGSKIGLVGSTGYSTGPHLHFSVYKNGRLIDPAAIIKK